MYIHILLQSAALALLPEVSAYVHVHAEKKGLVKQVYLAWPKAAMWEKVLECNYEPLIL